MNIVALIAPGNSLSQHQLKGLSVETFTTLTALHLETITPACNLVILDLHLSRQLSDFARHMVKTLRHNPQICLITLGDDTQLPTTLQNWSDYRASALPWRIVREKPTAIATRYREMRRRAPRAA